MNLHEWLNSTSMIVIAIMAFDFIRSPRPEPSSLKWAIAAAYLVAIGFVLVSLRRAAQTYKDHDADTTWGEFIAGQWFLSIISLCWLTGLWTAVKTFRIEPCFVTIWRQIADLTSRLRAVRR